MRNRKIKQMKGSKMANLLIRNLDDSTMNTLKLRAKKHGISQQAEAKNIICNFAVEREVSWSNRMRDLNLRDGGVESNLPPRTKSRCEEGIF